MFRLVASAAEDLTDLTYYPVDDDMGEHELQTLIRELLRPLLAHFLATLGRVAHVGSDQFMYWRKHRPTDSLSPDIYVLSGVPQDLIIASWKVWEHDGIAPSFALEIVSNDWEKDYRDNPPKYGELGTDELVLFDPTAHAHGAPRTPERVTWQVYRRGGAGLECVERSSADRVRCESLDCWLRVVGPPTAPLLRVAVGAHGDDLFPTLEEREREAKESEREAKEQARARMRGILRRQLEQRFGPLEPVFAARLAAADEDTLERLGDRIITAPTLAAVFAE